MKRLSYWLAGAAIGLGLMPAALAQGPMPGGMPAGAQANMKAWQTWRKNHRGVESLRKTVDGLITLDSGAGTKLSKAQAKAILPVLKAWRKKATISDAQARKVNNQLTGPLTVPQLKKLAALQRTRPTGPGGQGGPGGGPGGPPPGGFGGPGGPGGPPPGGAGAPPPGGRGGPGGPGMMPKPKDYNPLNPDSLPMPPERQRVKAGLDSLIHKLAAR
ncbi:MAG TPA: hypothetical protein VGM37_09755 [Armatimonadota bacterium]|jgi:hypothetical protein